MNAFSSALYTAEETREIDRATIEEFGIDGFTLMEIAANRAADIIGSRFSSSCRVLAVCGKGNNAGDALAASRILADHSFKVDVLFAFGTDGLSPDTEKNHSLLKKNKTGYIRFIDAPDFESYDLILDGLLGTGINADITGKAASLIDSINASAAVTCAMDIPSGIHGTTGKVMGRAVEAGFTCMFGTRKLGCYLNDGPRYAGERLLCRLPFPAHIMKQEYPVALADEKHADPLTRKKSAHKYEAGVVYIIGGSPGLSGAAILSAKAAWSAGSGAVTAIIPKGLSPAFDTHLVEQMRFMCGSSEDVFFKPDHISDVLKKTGEKPGVVLLGPGIGRNSETIKFTIEFLKNFTGRLVLDADGLYALSRYSPDVINPEITCILTPHPGELKRLHGLAETSPHRLREIIKTYPNPEKTTLVAKGNPTIAAGLNESAVTGYDTSDFARAGFGDVLAGSIAGIFSYSASPIKSCARALILGRTKMLEKQNKQIISPSDLI